MLPMARNKKMDMNREKMATEIKLARCRELAEEFRDGPTAQMVRDLEAELRQKISDFDKGAQEPEKLTKR
jgi:hypothetical protein